jgi:small-conductance mechanosensitive channel
MNIIKFKFTLAAILLLTFFWLLVVLIAEVTSQNTVSEYWESHQTQFWIPICLSFTMIVFGGFVDWYLNKLQKKEEESRLEVYRATVWASHHVLNNFLNKIYLIQHKAIQNGVFDEELSDMMGKMIQEAAGQLLELSQVDPIMAENIRKSVAP